MTDVTAEDLRWLDAAVRYATPFEGTTGDLPAAAALVVEPLTQTLVARAVTAAGGRPHAETQALEHAGFEAAGRTLYLTLEPCHHWGRTPPCTDAIIRSGIMRVVIGDLDPTPEHGGEGVAQLQSAGVEVVVANHAPSAQLHAGYAKRVRTGKPLVTLHMVVSADGMIGTSDDGRTAIAGPLAYGWSQMMRTRSDAIMIGAETARRDDPVLTVDLPGLARRTPLRVILSGAAGVDRKLNLVGGFSGHRTVIIAENATTIDAPVSVGTIRVAGVDGRPDLAAALDALGARGVQNLLVEPGPRLAAAFLEAELVDSFALVLSPASIGAGGRPASTDGDMVELLEAAGLVADPSLLLGDDVLTIYRRPA